MQSLIRAIRSQCRISSEIASSSSISSSKFSSSAFDATHGKNLATNSRPFGSVIHKAISFFPGSKLSQDCFAVHGCGVHSLTLFNGSASFSTSHGTASLRCFTTAANPVESVSNDFTASETNAPTRLKFKRLDKTARHIMQILDKEAVEEVKAHREIPDIKPGYIIQLKLEVPENKRRITTIKGIVIARRNAGLNTTFRIRRLVAGIGVESLLPLYSPNIKEIKVLDKKKVRRAKLYYLREKMNPLKK